MAKKLCISSHNLRSQALKNLQAELTERTGYKVWRVKPERVRSRIAVHFAKGVDKLTQYASFHSAGVSAPAYATTLEGVKELPGSLVVARKLLRGSEGRGLSIHAKEELLEKAPLYTQYIKKKKEFRAHVYNNKVIIICEKKKKIGFEGERDTRVRNTSNGYIFSRNCEFIPDDLTTVAISAVQSLGRTQGAVDILYNERNNKCYAIEVNARPGMEGSTPKIYADAILEDKNIKILPST